MRDPRVQRMIDDPEAYFVEARKLARAEAEAAYKREAALRRRNSERGNLGLVLPAVILLVAALVVLAIR